MTQPTSIAWATHSWNPLRGCSPISPGCRNCYASTMAHRFSRYGQPFFGFSERGRWTGKVELIPEILAEPLRWRKPKGRVFVNSMSDTFHEALTFEQIAAIFGVMACCPDSTFLVLTKRARRMREWFQWVDEQGRYLQSRGGFEAQFCLGKALKILSPECQERVSAPWPLRNVWLGVSAENQARAFERIPHLLEVPAALRWVSAEPLLEDITIRFSMPDPGLRTRTTGDWKSGPAVQWVVVGGESGPGARQCQVEWIRSLKDECKAAEVACFVKQLGANYCDAEGGIGGRQARTDLCEIRRLSDLAGASPHEWPEDLRVRQYPEVI